MYFHLEELKLSEGVFLTELTWAYRVRGQSFSSHYAIRHPGDAEVDDVLRSVDPGYQAPQRYHDMVIGTAFLTDYDSLPPGTHILGESDEQCKALEQYLRYVPYLNRNYVGNLKVMSGYLSDDTVRGIQESLRGIRRQSLGVDQ